MNRCRAFLLIIFVAMLVSCAQKPDDKASPKVSAEVPATERAAPSGSQDVRPGGAEILGSKIGIIESDHSSHGAVLCAWQMYRGLALYLDTCHPSADPGFREELDRGIDAINDFIVANSPNPISKAALRQQMDAEKQQAKALLKCEVPTNNNYAGLFEALRSMSRERLRTNIADLLSVPRPPVMNPCF